MTTPAEFVAYVNGEVMPQGRAVEMMQAMSLGAAGGFYDSERTFGGRVFKLRRHLERLYNGLEHSGMDPGVKIGEMAAATLGIVDANLPHIPPGADLSVTQIVSPVVGEGVDGGGFNVVIHCQPIDFGSFARGYVDGVRIETPATYRAPPTPGQRTYQLMADAEGSITECTGANFMFVSGGRIKLPDRRNVLPGVSMATVLELADELGIGVDEDDYATADLYEASEAFVTSTRICLQPVATVNGLRLGTAPSSNPHPFDKLRAGSDPLPALGEGIPGPVAGRLLEAWKEAVGLDFVAQALKA